MKVCYLTIKDFNNEAIIEVDGEINRFPCTKRIVEILDELKMKYPLLVGMELRLVKGWC